MSDPSNIPPPLWWSQFCAILLSIKTYLMANPTGFFAIKCSMFGFAFTFLDRMSGYIRNQKSLLGISYGKKNAVFIFACWILGAVIIGIVGSSLGFLQPTTISAGIVGVCWPVLFSKYVANLTDSGSNTDADEPVDEED